MNKATLPRSLEKQIKAHVYAQADAAKYLGMSREQSGVFMDQLAQSEKVGGILIQHMEKARIHRYIKDAILNRYSKDKSKENAPADLLALIEKKYSSKVTLSENGKDTQLFRSVDMPVAFFIVSQGTYLKWETALRKCLLYRAQCPFGKSANQVHQILLLSKQGKVIPPSDLKLLERALAPLATQFYLY